MKKSSQAGFTLFEIMLVIILVSFLAVAVAPRIASVSRIGAQSSVRRYTGLIRYAYDNAVLTGRVHRVVLNLDKQTWGVQAADPGELPLNQAAAEAAAAAAEKSSDKDEKNSSTSDGYKATGKNLIDKIPAGVQLVSFESWRIGRNVAATKGEVYIYAYPSGFIDEATVTLAQIGKEQVQNYRVSTKSLTGRVNVEIVNEGKREGP